MIRFTGLFAGLTCLLLATPASAALYRVGIGSGCTHATIQAAINAAEASAEADEVRITQTQTYVQQEILIDEAQGVLVLAGGFDTCQSNQPTPGARSVLNGNGTRSVLHISRTLTVRLQDLDIRGGGSSPGAGGGGIFVIGSNGAVLALSNTLVRNNQGTIGGGIMVMNAIAQGPASSMQLLLFGNSAVLGNSATIGGGIQCADATVAMFDQAHVSQNSASNSGGGIHARDCRLEIRSTGINGAVLLANNAGVYGGGLYITGGRSTGDVFTTDPFVPARITTNTAVRGGGVAVANDARVHLYNVNIEQNTASSDAGGVFVQGGGDTLGDSLFVMDNLANGGPSGAVACADAEACNLLRGNRALDVGDGERGPGAAVVVDASIARSAHAVFRGTRIESNVGTSLTRHTSNFGQVLLNGALVVRNDVSGVLFDAPGTANSLVLESSTIASNLFGMGRGVIKGSGGCDPNDDARGTQVWRSIVWQPGHPLLEAPSPWVPGCFRFLIGNDFAGLPASSERVAVDPVFNDINSADFRLSLGSTAVDFAPAEAATRTRDGGPRAFDAGFEANLFGIQDLGAYETFFDEIYADGFEDGDA